MVIFKQENGYPTDITLKTIEIDDGDFKGYKTQVYNKYGNMIREFYHTDYRARIHWADGYFSALRGR
jgi:hypothetical protein